MSCTVTRAYVCDRCAKPFTPKGDEPHLMTPPEGSRDESWVWWQICDPCAAIRRRIDYNQRRRKRGVRLPSQEIDHAP